MKKIVPLNTCEIPFSQHVCELVFGVNVPYLNLGVQINPIKQPIQSNSVGSGNMSHWWTSAFDDHVDHCLAIFKNCTAALHIGRNLRSWSRDPDLTIDQRSGYFLSST